jgi:site-specific DNA-methyltransferase (adenine-specific)
MKNGFVRGNFLYPAHYALLYYTKGKPRYFSRPKIKPMQCKKCGANIKDYGGYKSIIEKQGINLSDIWEDTSPVRHANRKKRAANELPPIIYERIFEISGKANTKFVEPFAGTGTGAIVAIKRKMSFLLCDLVEENYNLIINRISSELP